MDAASATADNIRVRDSAGNFIEPTNFQLRDDDRLAQIAFPGLPAGSYQIVISAAALTDRAGNPLARQTWVSSFTLTPRATLATTVPDAAPGTPGLQVFEGTTIPLTVTVVAGVTVQNVELLVNGEVVAADATAPYQFSAIAPNIASGADTLTLQSRVTDSLSVATLSNSLVIGLLEDVTPPVLIATSPANGSTTFRGLTTIQATFSEPLATASPRSATSSCSKPAPAASSATATTWS